MLDYLCNYHISENSCPLILKWKYYLACLTPIITVSIIQVNGYEAILLTRNLKSGMYLLLELIWCQAWWYTPVIPALRSWRQEDHKFQAIMGYITRPCLKQTEEKN
jgi:hypothetical protein